MNTRRRKHPGRESEPPLPDPLAYFLTWTTYGTWLPGDPRGWVLHGRGSQLPDPILELEANARMTEDACRLDHNQQELVEKTIAGHCRIRGWMLYAVNCRSNHVRVVVAANRHPDDVREQFKAWCTRRLKHWQRERRGTTAVDAVPSNAIRQNWWAERGSGLYINDDEALEGVIHYVLEAQDRPRKQ
jgi:hypothetical protein